MEGATTHRWSPLRKPARARSLASDRVTLALCLVFLPVAAFYLWTAGTTFPLAFPGSETNAYNELAAAFLHFHLSVGHAPAGLLSLSEPYNPAQNAPFQSGAYADIHDFALYRGNLFLTWGPAPALVLIPAHLLGLEPSSSVTAALFAIIGFGFALATLRVLLRQLRDPALWMCILAALTLGLSSVVPFMLRRPAVYEEALGGGFCFVMAGIWLAVSALVNRQATRRRLILMSVCFGLAAGSRPTLALTAVVLVPVYMSLRHTRSRRELLLALAVPVGTCFVLLMAYNQARFGSPLEIGAKYQLAGYDPQTAHFSDLSYVLPGAWFYAVAPPRLEILFPFIVLAPPPVSYPMGLPAHYLPTPEITGGLLPMTPILIFLAALPWIWRRRPALLGSLAMPLLLLTGAGLAALVFLSYEFFGTTERYEVDFSTVFLFGALAAWLALSCATRGRGRRLVQMGGALLAVWGCLTGTAISFVGYYNLLATLHPTTWRTLENISSPLSTAIAIAVGHPVLAKVSAPNITETHVNSTTLGVGVTSFWLSAGGQAAITIVSPDNRRIGLVANVEPGPELAAGASYGVHISGPSGASYSQALPRSGGPVRIPVQVDRGLNRLVLSPLATALKVNPAVESPEQLLVVTQLSLASHY